MNDHEALLRLQALGEKYRNHPLETFSDESLVNELERRGYWCFDNRITPLIFVDESLDFGNL